MGHLAQRKEYIFLEQIYLFWELNTISITFATLSVNYLTVITEKGSSGGSSAR